MKGRITWETGVCFSAQSETGHQVSIDGPADMGGKNQGMRPMEMVMLGTAGCSTFDVMTILKRSRQDVTACDCEVEAQRADAVPAVFTHLHLHFRVAGRQLKESQVKKAVSLSAEKYCSASIMLGAAGVEISHSYEIVDA